MILVDSSVWIDYFAGQKNRSTEQLITLLSDTSATLGVADLVLFEVLRGFRRNRDLQAAQHLMTALPQVELGGMDNALAAAQHFRELQAQGYTIRSPIDVLLASYCIAHDHVLLHRDADFDVMQTLRGLQVVRH